MRATLPKALSNPRMHFLARCFALTFALVAFASAVRADDGAAGRSVHWDPAWTHAATADYVLAGVGVTGLGLELALLQSKQPALHWSRPILFDVAVRNALRASTPEARNATAAASWVLMGIVSGYPVLVDVPYAWARYGYPVARDLFWQDASALSLAAAIDLGVRDVVGRARPSVSDCLASGASASQCLGNDTEATRSFPGGHVALSSTSAVLVCTQHLSMQLYGAPWDAVTCGAALTANVAVGTLRIVSDNHWATDVLAGGAIGFAFGWVFPVVMHFHGHSNLPSDSAAPNVLWAPAPIAFVHGAGLGVTGLF